MTLPLPEPAGDVSSFADIDVVALDVDGTLLSPAVSELAAHLLEAQRALAAHRSPVGVVLVTGRPWAGVQELVRGFCAPPGRSVPHVVHFGSVVAGSDGEGALFRTAIPADVVTEVAGRFVAHGLAPSIVECRSDLSEVHWSVGGTDPTGVYDFGVPVRRVTSVPSSVEAQVVLAPASPDEAHAALGDLGHLAADGLLMDYHAPSGTLFVDSPGASKAEGLALALGQLGVPPERVLAVGDSAPDVAMFELARLGVAVGSAEPGTVAAADFVCHGGPSEAVVEVLEVLLAARGR